MWLEAAVIIGIVSLIILLIFSEVARVILYIILALIGIYIIFKLFVKQYNEFERAIIFRFGKFHRIAGPGWSIVIPFIEKEYKKLDVRTKTTELLVPLAFTKDDLRVKLVGMVYYTITDARKAVLNIENFLTALRNIIVSETRNLIASMSMRELFANMGRLNEMLAERIRHATWKWGINVPFVQVSGITPPVEIAEAMQRKEIAAQMLQAQKFRAEARKIAIEAIGEAAKKLDDRAVMYLYLKALEEIGKGSATKIIFPMQFIDVLKGMEKDIGKGIAGLNVSSMINAIKDKILEAK